MNNFKKISFLLTGKEKYNLAIISLFNLLGVLLEMLSFVIIIPVFNLIFLKDKSYNHLIDFFFDHDFFDKTNAKIIILVILILLFCFKNFFLVVINYVSIKFYNFLNLRISNSLFELYLKQDYSFFLSSKSDFLIRKLINDTMGVKTYLNLLQNLIIDILLIFSFSVVLMYTNIQIFIFFISIFGFFGFLYLSIIKKRIAAWSYLYQTNLGVLQNTINEGSKGIKDLIIYDLISSFKKKFTSVNYNTFISFFKIDFINNIQRFWMEIIAILAMISPLIISLFLNIEVNELIPIFVLFSVGLFKIVPTLNRIIQGYQILKFNKPSLDIIYQQFSELKNKDELINKIDFKFGLEFKDVNYTYQSDKFEVLKNLNFKINKGESIAIIGANGTGKTTLLNLISGLIAPTKGKILLDNYLNIFEIKKSWFAKISYVQQNIFLFNSTIKANIICEDEKNYRIEKYNNLKKIMPIDEIFSRFPNGLDTVVGKDGINLSGGQKQLISIARALYKNSEIIIFDEANSALDKEYTEVLEKIIFELKGKKTIIFVTHDMLLLKKSFDKIYKLHSGEIILQ
jgi:ABC-type multidrug transport system fused ATPase/permease subunit